MTISIPEQYQSLKTKLETIVKKAISPKLINANDDLNDYRETGMYYCDLSHNDILTISNCPVSDGFTLFVQENHCYNEGVKQVLTHHQSSATYIRVIYTDYNDDFYSSGWKPLWEDTGWTNITSFSSKFQNYYPNRDPLQFRRIGKIVHFRGLVTNKVEITNGGNSEVIFTIPSDCRPSATIRLVMHGSYSYRFVLTLNPNGNATIERYGSGTTYSNLSSSGVWMNLYGTYFVD